MLGLLFQHLLRLKARWGPPCVFTWRPKFPGVVGKMHFLAIVGGKVLFCWLSLSATRGHSQSLQPLTLQISPLRDPCLHRHAQDNPSPLSQSQEFHLILCMGYAHPRGEGITQVREAGVDILGQCWNATCHTCGQGCSCQ